LTVFVQKERGIVRERAFDLIAGLVSADTSRSKRRGVSGSFAECCSILSPKVKRAPTKEPYAEEPREGGLRCSPQRP